LPGRIPCNSTAMRHQGRITTWKDDKGFGFITPNGSREQVFVHIRAFAHAGRRPMGGELVTFELTVGLGVPVTARATPP